MLRSAVLLMAAVLVWWSSPGAAQPDVASRAQADLGLGLARIWCSQCHLVEPPQGAAERTEAPAFGEIANRAGQSREALESFLTDPHPPMPDLQLSRAQTRNLALYILSLRPEGAGQ